MSRTKRNVSHRFETRFKLGDPKFPEDNDYFFDGRYQAKMRNKVRTYHSMKIDTLSYKVISWKECGKWAKRDARQAARHNTKLLTIKMINEILIEQIQDLEDLWAEEESYDDYLMSFDYFYEARQYAEERRQQELDEYEYWDRYDPYMDLENGK